MSTPIIDDDGELEIERYRRDTLEIEKALSETRIRRTRRVRRQPAQSEVERSRAAWIALANEVDVGGVATTRPVGESG